MDTAFETYEQMLDNDRQFAWREGGMHFENESEVHKTLSRISRRLDELGIDYALAGAMAMYKHGHRRFTHDVDLIVTREGLECIHEKLEGLGYVRLFAGSKALRDAQNRVKIDFILTGDYPGGGKPGPIAFPDPAEVSVEIDGVKIVKLETLIELKLASGQAEHRVQDLADAQGLIAALDLPLELQDKVHPSLRTEYARVWSLAQKSKQDDY